MNENRTLHNTNMKFSTFQTTQTHHRLSKIKKIFFHTNPNIQNSIYSQTIQYVTQATPEFSGSPQRTGANRKSHLSITHRTKPPPFWNPGRYSARVEADLRPTTVKIAIKMAARSRSLDPRKPSPAERDGRESLRPWGNRTFCEEWSRFLREVRIGNSMVEKRFR